MSTAIVYYSHHHGNTKKLVDAIAAAHDEVTLIDATKAWDVDLSGFDRIGLASGVYAGNLGKPVLRCAGKFLPEGKKVFLIYTSASTKETALKAIRALFKERNCREIGAYYCQGFNTFGPFKLVGGIAKGHPTEEEIRGAVEFYKDL